jgi:carboxynorspermidine decarboxylase
LRLLAPRVDGFSVSSLFEARLARLAGKGSLHITTPGLRCEEIDEIGALCDFMAFNSLEQFRRYAPLLSPRTSAGLRINPKLSFLQDPRFDPCRAFSKLGVSCERLIGALEQTPALAGQIRGLHVHNTFASRSFAPMAQTVERVEAALMHRLPGLRWVNLGGGYLFESADDLQPLCRIVDGLRSRWGVAVFFEPGKAMVGAAGYLVARVIDLFDSDGKLVAVLDTSVNHHPEIFEYQTRPQPDWEEPEEGYSAILAGCTCLAGDVLGEFRFASRLALGDRVVFRNVGAYSLIKANRFNGHNLPSIYAWDGGVEVRRLKQYSFVDYLGQWADEPGADAAPGPMRTPSALES